MLFLGLAQPYLRQFNVEIDREVELGRGPVDFKAASGTTARVLIEVRRCITASSGTASRPQLPSYLTSDGATHGWFLALQYRGTKSSVDRIRRLPSVVAVAASRTGMTLRSSVVDARKPLSASNIEASDELPLDEVTGDRVVIKRLKDYFKEPRAKKTGKAINNEPVVRAGT